MDKSEVLDLLRSDMRRNAGISLDALKARLLLMEVRLEQFVYRTAQASNRPGVRLLWQIVRGFGSVYQWQLCNSNIPGSVNLGRGLRLPHPQNIIVAGTATIGNYATIYQNVTIAWNGFDHVSSPENSPRLGDCVLLGTGAIVLGNVTIGDYSLIGAGSVVVRSIPSHSRVTGALPSVTSRPISESAAVPGSPQHLRDPYSIYR